MLVYFIMTVALFAVSSVHRKFRIDCSLSWPVWWRLQGIDQFLHSPMIEWACPAQVCRSHCFNLNRDNATNAASNNGHYSLVLVLLSVECTSVAVNDSPMNAIIWALLCLILMAYGFHVEINFKVRLRRRIRRHSCDWMLVRILLCCIHNRVAILFVSMAVFMLFFACFFYLHYSYFLWPVLGIDYTTSWRLQSLWLRWTCSSTQTGPVSLPHSCQVNLCMKVKPFSQLHFFFARFCLFEFLFSPIHSVPINWNLGVSAEDNCSAYLERISVRVHV